MRHIELSFFFWLKKYLRKDEHKLRKNGQSIKLNVASLLNDPRLDLFVVVNTLIVVADCWRLSWARPWCGHQHLKATEFVFV